MSDHEYEWWGVDLDGTLAEYTDWKGPIHIGKPIQPMVDRVKQWLAEGKNVRIFTARVDGGAAALAAGNPDGVLYEDVDRIVLAIQAWCVRHIGQALPVTNQKDYGMRWLYDDRCVQVETNTGRLIGGSE